MSFFGSLADRVQGGSRGARGSSSTRASTPCSSVGRPVDEALLEELEEMLVASDLGAATAAEFVDRVRAEAKRGRATPRPDVRALLRRFLEETLAPPRRP